MYKRNVAKSIKNPDELPDYVAPIINESEIGPSRNPPKDNRKVYDENGREVIPPQPLPQRTEYKGPHAIGQTLFGSPFKQFNSPQYYQTSDDQIKFNYEYSRYEFYKYLRDKNKDPKDYYPFDPKYDMDPTKPDIHPRKKPKKIDRPASHTMYYPPTTQRPQQTQSKPKPKPAYETPKNDPPPRPLEDHDPAEPSLVDDLRDETNKHIQDMNQSGNNHNIIQPAYVPDQPTIKDDDKPPSHLNPEYTKINLPTKQFDNTVFSESSIYLQTCKPEDTSYHLTLRDYNKLIDYQIYNKGKIKNIYDIIF